MDHPNPLLTFAEYRQHVLRWYWYDLPKDPTEAEREAFSADVEEKIRIAYEERLDRIQGQKNYSSKKHYERLAWQYLHFDEKGESF